MLRQRFMLSTANKNGSQEYTSLERKILEFEVTREDEALRPNTNKSEKRGKKKENETQNETQTTEKISNTPLQNIKKTQEKNQTKLIETLKGVDTIEKFPLFEIKNVRVMAETATYRVLKANNCPVELRLFKLNIEGEKRFSMGEKIEIFGVMKSTKDQYIKVKREKKK
ncbi:TPA: hypothetical protein DCZ39_04945 [Patescibacteria group bacterium]|nr:hypothetical protein [Candidatus Gracilibacteria bacterium]